MGLSHGGNIFSVAREHGWDWRDVLDFSASINPLGPAPGVRSAIAECLDRIVHYPERDSPLLCDALARGWGVKREHVLAGNGATELIFFLARVLRPAQVTIAVPAFSEFHRAFPEAGRAQLSEPATWPSGGVLVLTRPANPTGVTLPMAHVEEWLASRDGIAIVDESFLEFSKHESVMKLAPQCDRLIVMRSLTKFYALPGLRIGALVSSRKWGDNREPWQVNALAESAAIAAASDETHGAKTREFIAREREWLTREIAALQSAKPHPSDANFIRVEVPDPTAVCEHLLRNKLMVRNCTGWPGAEEESVRVAVRLRHENEILLKHWRAFACA